MGTKSSFVCDQRWGHRRVATVCLLEHPVSGHHCSDSRAVSKGKFERELSTTSNSTEREKSVSVDTYLDPPMHFELVKPISRLLDDLN